MAYILDKKVVTDTEEFSNQAYGITLPVQRGNTGYFSQAFSSFEQAKSNLRNLNLGNKMIERTPSFLCKPINCRKQRLSTLF